MSQGIFNPFFQNGAQWYGSGSGGDTPDIYTTADDKQLFGIIGDSLGGTSDSGPGPTPTGGTVFEWTGAVENEITNADLSTAADQTGSTAGANAGSPWPQCGITYNAGSSKKSVFIDNHVGGTSFSPVTGDLNVNWSATGTRRALTETKIDSAITQYGVTPKAIFVTLGSNDVRGATAIATILSDIDDFFTWITTKYPNTDIVVMQVGQTERVNGSVNTEGSARAHQIRARIKQNALTNARVHFAGNGGTVATFDSLHWAQAGNNIVGNMFANWLLNPTQTKWARSIISSIQATVTSAQKTLIENWVSGISYTTGLDTFYLWRKSTSDADAFNDWGFEAFCTKQSTVTLGANGFTVAASGYIKSKCFGNSTLFATRDDVLVGVEVITQTGNGSLFGVRNPSTTAELGVQFVSPNRSYRANDTTATSVAGDFTDGNAYYVTRDAGTKALLSNTSTDNSAAVASTADITLEMFVFGRNNNGSVDTLMTGTLGYFVWGKNSVIGSVAHNAIQTLLNNW